MTDQTKYIRDIEDIKKLMEKSTRFLSLSGLSGIIAGIVALLGAAAAYWLMELKNIRYDTHLRIIDVPGDGELFWQLILLAVVVLVLALAATVYFSWRKARRYHLPFWDPSARRLLFHLSVPLAAGGIFAIILILRNDITLLASVVLIFYGLALLNAGKYTLREVQVLGLLEIGMGLLAGIFIHYGLLFWAVGFGVLHIVYGTLMYLKYERKKTSQ